MTNFSFPLSSDAQPLLDLPADISIHLDRLGHPVRSIREQAVHSLVGMGAAAIDPLIAYVTGPFRHGRNMAARSLGLIGDARAIPTLTRLLHDEDEIVRSVAAWALGEIGDAAVIPHLISATRDQRQCVRNRAAASLQQLGHLPPTPVAPDPALVRQLISQLSSRSEFSRNRASQLLIRMGVGVMPSILDTLSAIEPWARQAAVEIVGVLGPDEAALKAVAILAEREPDQSVRQAARVLLHANEA